jgi:hypothetical protein
MASMTRADSSWQGPGLYLALTFALAWLPAFLLRDLLSGAATR